MDHTTEQIVPPIEELTYTAANYLKRKVVKPDEIENAKGGDVIDLLTKPRTYVGGGHVQSKGLIFDNKADHTSVNNSRMASMDK